MGAVSLPQITGKVMHLKELCLRKPLNQQQVLQWLVSLLALQDSHETVCHVKLIGSGLVSFPSLSCVLLQVLYFADTNRSNFRSHALMAMYFWKRDHVEVLRSVVRGFYWL